MLGKRGIYCPHITGVANFYCFEQQKALDFLAPLEYNILMIIHPNKLYKMSSKFSLYPNEYVFVVESTSTYVKIQNMLDSYYFRDYFENHATEASEVETLLFWDQNDCTYE